MLALTHGQVVVLAGCAGGLAAPADSREERAPRAQVVDALAAVVPPPAPLDGDRALPKVGLRGGRAQAVSAYAGDALAAVVAPPAPLMVVRCAQGRPTRQGHPGVECCTWK